MSNVLSKMEWRDSSTSVSCKTLSEAKYNVRKYELKCNCMLCTKDGVEKPTLFCEWTNVWKSQFVPCCCVTDLKHECKQTMYRGEYVKCLCPRCCRACFYGNRISNEKCNGWCHSMNKTFTQCVHFKGFCH